MPANPLARRARKAQPATAPPAEELAGKVAVITGGSRGLGAAIAELLGSRGATVVVGARSQRGVDDAVARLRAAGVAAYGVACDVGRLADVEALRDAALAHGGLDIWVNNAGTSGPYGPTHRIPAEEFQRVVATNILGTAYGCRTAIPAMLERGGGHVINLYGRGDTRPVPLQNAYASSKTWVRSFTRTLQRELRGTGVAVHGLNPGLVTTEMLGEVTAMRGYEDKLRGLPVVVGLWGQPPEVAARPVLALVTGRGRGDYRDLTTPRLLGRTVRSLREGRLRADRRMPMRVTAID